MKKNEKNTRRVWEKVAAGNSPRQFQRQGRKISKAKKLGKKIGNSPGQFQNVLEVKEGQAATTIKHEKNNDKNGQKKSRNGCFQLSAFWQFPGTIPEAKAEKTIKTNRNEKGRFKKKQFGNGPGQF